MARRGLLLSSAAESSAHRLALLARNAPNSRISDAQSRAARVVRPDQDPAIDELLQTTGVDPSELPVVFTGDTLLRRVSAGSLAEYLGLTIASLPSRNFDLVIAGGRPGRTRRGRVRRF